MLIHLDTSVLVDSFTGPRRSLADVRTATSDGHVIAFCAIVQYEWLRGPRREGEEDTVRRFFGGDAVIVFGDREARAAASLYRRVVLASNPSAVSTRSAPESR